MPSKNTVRIDVSESYYHVYARGASKGVVFNGATDFVFFLGLFDRYLSPKQSVSKEGVVYPNYSKDVELLAFCLLPNHFHLLVYQTKEGSLTKLMRSVMTSYSRYFNYKYKRTGSLFESRFKSSRIDTDSYLTHISRYVHLNTRYWQNYSYSSYRFYVKGNEPQWLNTTRVLELFEDRNEYQVFHLDYEDHKSMLDELKYELADQ